MNRLPCLLALGAALGACSNNAPQLGALQDQIAYVDSEFTLQLQASDADGDQVTFGFTSADLQNIENRAHIQPSGPLNAVFHYTPVASDVGIHAFDFTASDGHDTTRVTITIEIKPAVGLQNAPIFREPLGTGTTLDLTQKPCGGLAITVEDQDSTEVTITQEAPLIDGATLEQNGPMTAQWNWCPTAAEIAADDRYMLHLAASDGDHKTTKDYLIVLRKGTKPDCPGAAPVVNDYTDAAQNTLLPVLIDIDVSDDVGIKHEPLVYYALTPPADPPDLAQMTQLSMLLIDGDMRSGWWAVEVPNPVVNDGAGASADVYYVIVAQDNDDETGDCDHLTQFPATGAARVTVTNPGGEGGRGLCEPCTADVQCGGPADNCLSMGTAGEAYCLQACTTDTDCPAGYLCFEFASVDGVSALQCVPESLSCGPAACVDDAYEENDSLAAVTGITPLAPGTYSNLKSCGSDEDWYPINVTADAQVTITIAGGSATDLDLSLSDGNGTVVTRSTSLTSQESVTTCLTPGRYYVRVFSWGTAENSYTLTYGSTPKSCMTSCADDGWEDDDTASQARLVTFSNGVFTSLTNAICADDDDWYEVDLAANQTVYVTLAFYQSNAKEDLDIRFYQAGTPPDDLIGCVEAYPINCSDNGQSSDSNENFSYTVPTSGTYYVVVHGWNGSENLYDICIGTTSTACPPLP